MSDKSKTGDGRATAAMAGDELWEWMRSVHLEPEIARRLATGDLEEGSRIWFAQVLFWQDRPPQVRLNEEVQGTLQAEARGPIEKGQEITTEDMGSVSGFLLPEADGDAAHITMLVTATGPCLVFDAAYNTLRIQSQLKAADEFLKIAAVAVEHGTLRAFAENAFGACELLASAELLWLPDKRVMTRKHMTVRSFYNQWAKLENTDLRFAGLLNRLGELRASARYLRADFELGNSEASEILSLLGEMRDHVEAVRVKRTLGNRVPRGYRVIATRDMRAGEMMTPGDAQLFK
ncbi:MAG TPA: hypothetical protein VIS95_05405 [Solirubrobacterales bacterium]